MNRETEHSDFLYAIAREGQLGFLENDSRAALVTNILKGFGFSAKLNGFLYIRTAILLAVQNPELLHLMTKTLYPQVARIHHTTASRVDRSIRHALDRCWICADTDMIEAFFGNALRVDRKRPSGGEFIAVIADSIFLLEGNCEKKPPAEFCSSI